MPFGFRIESLSFANHEEPVRVLDSEVVVLIGPNNSGKSQALRDIDAGMFGDPTGLAIKRIASKRVGSADEMLDWVRSTSVIRPDGNPGMVTLVNSRGNIIDLNTAVLLWTQDHLNSLARFFVLHADAETRLQLAGSVPSISVLDGEAIKPLQRLLSDHESEARLSDAVRQAFDIDVCVNRAGGSELSIHLGHPHAEPRLDSSEYLAELKSLPLVSSQGDGMRSFIGLMLTLIATEYPVVLIDEPEAFLHPPQARELGRQLGAPSSQQRFIATHSVDVLLGLLDRVNSLTVIRLNRHKNDTVASVLDHAQIKELWRDPSFRYSNLLDGLFHTGVVICEADGDARLYAATLDVLREGKNKPTSDLLFTQCGGKHKLPVAINALRPLGVPVCVIADLDVLRDRLLLERIVVGLGGSWADIERDWVVVSAAVNNMPVQAPIIKDVRQTIDRLLGTEEAARLSEHQTRRIRDLTKSSDGWRLIREAGGSFPRGEATTASEKLLESLAAFGLFVVPVGALEQWERTIGKYGSAFVDAALAAGVHENNHKLREFVGSLDAHLSPQNK